ncbi:uncharacterized protein PSANT_06971 [Moesziomyces antarcticus]|uniref:Major facilitator superfamily (MFS) profile domain-containing protein n=1 Tax=Pseudozyma antarctica TaxID=84753 RepID=A0A5C3FYG8_PSEA2|nr:uncharacterized protein PSANT_06971 [Moesziomyces antarcticus]
MALPPKLYTWLCGCFAALGSILFGYDTCQLSCAHLITCFIVLTPSAFTPRSIVPDFLRVTKDPNSDYIGFIVSSMLLGAFVGCIPASLIADAFSRRFAIMVGAIVFILGGVLQTAAANQGMMMAGRFFAGVGIGMLSLLAPKFAPSSIKGSKAVVGCARASCRRHLEFAGVGKNKNCERQLPARTAATTSWRACNST